MIGQSARSWALAFAAVALGSCSHTRGIQELALPVSLQAISADYEKYAGRLLRVEGFLTFSEERASLVEGRDNPSGPLLDGERYRYWCTFEGQPASLGVQGLSTAETRRISYEVRTRPISRNIEGQKVVVEGVLKPGGDTRDAEFTIPGPPLVFGPLQRARLVAVERSFCIGHEGPRGP